jgi:hypothetical protein
VKQTDIHQRVAQLKAESKPTGAPIDPYEVAGFNRADVEKITDPAARQYVENMAKSFEAGFTKKFQSLADERRQLEAQRTAPPSNQPWTVERLNAELQRPDFVTAAQQAISVRSPQQVAGGLTEQEYSNLTEGEKQQLAQATQANQGVAALQGQLQQMQRQQEDASLQQKYASYNAQEVDGIFNGMLNGSIQATREHLWKVVDYDNAVARAYELGRTDERGGITEKAQVSSPAGVAISQSGGVPPKEANESGVAYFKRLALARMQQQGRTPAAH